jgi:hypothetical protein
MNHPEEISDPEGRGVLIFGSFCGLGRSPLIAPRGLHSIALRCRTRYHVAAADGAQGQASAGGKSIFHTVHS